MTAFLDISKLDSMLMSPVLAPSDISLLVEDMIKIFSHRTKAKGIDLLYELDESVSASLMLDVARLRQVLLNLVGNAVKFTEEGRICVRVRAWEKVIDNTGRIVTSSSIGGLTNVVAIFQQGEFEMKPLTTTSPFSVYDISNPVESTFIPATLSDSDNLQLAQSVILLSGRQGNIVSTGIINDLDVSLVGDVETVSNIDAGIDVNKVLIGSIILNLKGEIVGVKIGSGTVNDTTFLPVNNLKNFLSTLSVE